MVTATTTMKTATKMLVKPAHVSQPIWWNFRTDAVAVITIVPMNDHQTVHAACVESALRPTDTPRIPEPAQRTYATRKRAPTSSFRIVPPRSSAMSAME